MHWRWQLFVLFFVCVLMLCFYSSFFFGCRLRLGQWPSSCTATAFFRRISACVAGISCSLIHPLDSNFLSSSGSLLKKRSFLAVPAVTSSVFSLVVVKKKRIKKESGTLWWRVAGEATRKWEGAKEDILYCGFLLYLSVTVVAELQRTSRTWAIFAKVFHRILAQPFVAFGAVCTFSLCRTKAAVSVSFWVPFFFSFTRLPFVRKL